jgi:hypothetical protein
LLELEGLLFIPEFGNILGVKPEVNEFAVAGSKQ